MVANKAALQIWAATFVEIDRLGGKLPEGKCDNIECLVIRWNVTFLFSLEVGKINSVILVLIFYFLAKFPLKIERFQRNPVFEFQQGSRH